MRRLRREEGSVMIVCMAVLAIMTTLSVVALSGATAQQKRSGATRGSESAFQLAEAALNTQLTMVGASWPASQTTAHPASCTPAIADARCPDASVLAQRFDGHAPAGSATWEVALRDDVGDLATSYSKDAADSTPCAGGVGIPCAWDSNGNGVLWLRAEAVVANRKRVLVTQLRQIQTRLPFPRNVIVAGRFTTTNNGRKTIVDEKGCLAKHRPAATCNATEPAPLAVRCASTGAGTPADDCLGYRSDQVAPNLTLQSYDSSVVPTGGLEQLRSAAIQAGTYFTSCPSASQLAGRVVFIDGVSCSYSGSGSINTAAAPGVLVVDKGALTLGGSLEFYGVIFMANNLPSPAGAGTLFSLQGNAFVQGSVFVEGEGAIEAGSSGLNISFDPNALSNVIVPAGGAAQVPNSFRELPADA